MLNGPLLLLPLMKKMLSTNITSIGYLTKNTLKNTGDKPWQKENGLLSIWLLGMFNHTPTTTVVIPYKSGEDQELGPVVNDDYFGKVPPDRLKVDEKNLPTQWSKYLMY